MKCSTCCSHEQIAIAEKWRWEWKLDGHEFNVLSDGSLRRPWRGDQPPQHVPGRVIDEERGTSSPCPDCEDGRQILATDLLRRATGERVKGFIIVNEGIFIQWSFRRATETVRMNEAMFKKAIDDGPFGLPVYQRP